MLGVVYDAGDWSAFNFPPSRLGATPAHAHPNEPYGPWNIKNSHIHRS